MDEKTSRHFAEIIELAESVFKNVVYEIDATPDRSILRIKADYGKYEILVTELISDGKRKYRYYVMKEDWVEAGFDNALTRVPLNSNMEKSAKNILGKIFRICTQKIKQNYRLQKK